MNVQIAIPWRPTDDRTPAFARVAAWWRDRSYQVRCADSIAWRPFNVAEARNAAVTRCHTDVVVIADADTIPDEHALEQAITLARDQRTVVYPFTEYRHIPADALDVDDLSTVAPIRVFGNSAGGLMVMQRSLYWELGGQDVRFTRWGFEDSAFRVVAQTLASVERIPGTVYAFDHPADRDLTEANAGLARSRLYQWANGDAPAMRELIRC